jgi:gliding motility-associated-like protein
MKTRLLTICTGLLNTFGRVITQHYPKSHLRVFALILSLLAATVFQARAQAPSVSYSGPQTYAVGTAITPLTPVSSNVDPFKFSRDSIPFIHGIEGAAGITQDPDGNLYITSLNGSLLKYTVSNGHIDTLLQGLTSPFSIVSDDNGSIYFTQIDPAKHWVYKISTDGSNLDSIGTSFIVPTGLAKDVNGNIYVADAGDGTIKIIKRGTGQVVRFMSGLNDPFSLAIDNKSENLYAGNFGLFSGSSEPGSVKKINIQTKVIELLADSLFFPSGIAVDGADNVYVSDLGTGIIRAYAPDKTLIDSISTGVQTVGILIHHGGNLLVTNLAESAISAFPPLGGYSVHPALPAGLHLSNETGIISGKPAATSAARDYTVVAYNASGQTETTVNIKVIGLTGLSLSAGSLSPAFGGNVTSYTTTVSSAVPSITVTPVGDDVTSIITVNGDVVVSGTPSAAITLAGNSTDIIVILTGSDGSDVTYTVTVNKLMPPPAISYAGSFVYPVGLPVAPIVPAPASGVAAPGYSSMPEDVFYGSDRPGDIAVDTAGNVYVTDYGSASLYKIPADGSAAVVLDDTYSDPAGVAVDESGNIYTTDYNTHTLYKTNTGGVRTVISSNFSSPGVVKVDAEGNLYVIDYDDFSNVLYKIPAGGNTPTVVNTGIDGASTLVVDAAGNIYVTDYYTGVIVKIPANGGAPSTVDIAIDSPNGLTFDGAGNLYVTDYYTHALYKVPANGSTPVMLNDNFSIPASVEINKDGNLFIVDLDLGSIKKLSPVGGYHISPLLPGGLSINDTTGVISGTPLVGSPAKNYTITGYNEGGKGTGTINIETTDNVGLTGLALSAGTLSPAFAKKTTTYRASVTSASIVLTPTTDDITAAILINGVPVASGAATAAIPLTGGDNIINVTVKNADSIRTKTYALTVTRVLSNNANLSYMNTNTTSKVIRGTNTSGVIDYFTSVDPSTAGIQVIPVAQDTTATITVNGFIVSSGTPSPDIALDDAGPTLIDVMITAQNGVRVKQYSLTVNKNGSNNAYLSLVKLERGSRIITDSRTVAYEGTVDVAALTANLIPVTQDAHATITVNGVPVINGKASGPITLDPGATTVNVVVTAQDGVSVRNYTVKINKNGSDNALLTSIKMDPNSRLVENGAGSKNYITSVDPATASVRIIPTAEDPNAVIEVNGMVVISGRPSTAIPLDAGPTVISVVVTAQNGVATKTYSVTVNRTGGNNAYLSQINLSTGVKIYPPANKLSHDAFVGADVSSLTLTPTAQDANATITVNGIAVQSGQASDAITLNSGPTVINIVVTSQNAVSVKQYTVTVYRTGSNNAKLTSIALKPNATLTLVNSSGSTDYTTTVSAATTSVKVIPKAEDPNAVITVNGTVVASGAASDNIPLDAGQTLINVLVTAQNGTTVKQYSVTVTKTGSSDINITAIKASSGAGAVSLTHVSATRYSASVAQSVDSVWLKITTAHAGATITVNGTPVASNVLSAPVVLAEGSNTITIVITAENGVNTKTNIVTITRAAMGLMARRSFNANPEVVVHQGLSPNGDGVNDFLQIDGIQAYRDNRLMVMNSAGALVFDVKGYDNGAQLFDGRSGNGKSLQQGTYFFVLEYKNGGKNERKTGYIVLKY